MKGIKVTKEEFIERSNKIHNFKYNYSSVEFVDYRTKVLIKCPNGHTFLQEPAKHLRGHGCRFCTYEHMRKPKVNNKVNKVNQNKQDIILKLDSFNFKKCIKLLIHECFKRFPGYSRNLVAKELGMPSPTLLSYIKRFGLDDEINQIIVVNAEYERLKSTAKGKLFLKKLKEKGLDIEKVIKELK